MKLSTFFLVILTINANASVDVAFNGEFYEFLSENKDLSSHSVHIKAINPFDGKLIHGFINPKKIPSQFSNIGRGINKPTAGSFWHNYADDSGDYFRMDIDGLEELELIDELTPAIEDGRVLSILEKNNFIINEDFAIRSILVRGEFDSIYTVFHELAHTESISNNRYRSHKLSLKFSKKFNTTSKDHYKVHQSIREAVADLSSVIYMINHGMIHKNNVKLFLTGLIVDRVRSASYFEINKGERIRIKGDETHNTSGFLLYFLDLMNKNEYLTSSIKDDEIIDFSLNLIGDYIETSSGMNY